MYCFARSSRGQFDCVLRRKKSAGRQAQSGYGPCLDFEDAPTNLASSSVGAQDYLQAHVDLRLRQILGGLEHLPIKLGYPRSVLAGIPEEVREAKRQTEMRRELRAVIGRIPEARPQAR